ncbi:MAG: adenylyltransferase [Spirochaetes bacterium DG_61]|nr:MAG: adenylyltransferase [Spirochaetes bacterium DG_61]
MRKTQFLTPEERERYDRQLILSGWGEEGQKKLKAATVFIAGAGGLGSAAGVYLAAAGVGCIRLCDSGKVELSNLNRQILYSDSDIGEEKVQSAIRTLRRINPHVRIVGLKLHIDSSTVANLVADSDIMVDCLDNFETRYVLNRHAVANSLPLVHAGVYGMAGQISFLHSPHTPCLRCIFPEPPSKGVFPVVGATAGVIGCLEAFEVLKYLTGLGGLLKNRLLIWEGDLARFEEVKIGRNLACPICAKKQG